MKNFYVTFTMKIKDENEPNSSLRKLEISWNEKTRSMIDATNSAQVRTLSITRRSNADRLNAHFSYTQNSSSIRLHLTSRFRLSIENTRLAVFTIYANFSPSYSSHCSFFSAILHTACKRKAVKSGRFEKHMLTDIFGKFYPCWFSFNSTV